MHALRSLHRVSFLLVAFAPVVLNFASGPLGRPSSRCCPSAHKTVLHFRKILGSQLQATKYHRTNPLYDVEDNVATSLNQATLSSPATVNSNGRSSTVGAEDAYRYFDFESSAEAAYVSPAVSPDEMFQILKAEASALVSEEILNHHFSKHIFGRKSIASCLASVLTSKLANDVLKEESLYNLFENTFLANPKLVSDMVHDLLWIRKIDPATIGYIQPLLFFKGFHAIQVQRLTHVLWSTNKLQKMMIALSLQSRVAEVFGVDAHPGARISHSVMLDHASGIVIGETAAIGHSCYILHGVTLGATGKSSSFDRHPKVRNNVKIGAGAMILGNIALDDGVVVGAGAVVTNNVAKGETVVGVNRILSHSKAYATDDDMGGWDFTL